VSSVEIHCPACREQAFLLREPVYDGFTKSGEALSCSHCGHSFESEEDVPFKEKKALKIFTDADRSHAPEVFKEDEFRMCHRCTNYVANPFMQWCDLHRKEVQATDTCSKFKERKEEGDDPVI
jgi:hypothetical protein